MSSLRDGITINNKHSFRDFDLCISDKTVNFPDKEVITDTVPFMSGYYDFSNVLGNLVFKERTLEYVFDLLSTDNKNLEEVKTDVASWLMLAHDVDIYDDELSDYHFHGSFNGCSWVEDEEYGELKINFKCYPFKIANEETEITLSSGNNSISYTGMPVNLYIVSTGSTTVSINSTDVSVSTTKAMLSLPLTNNGLTIAYAGEETVKVSYRGEVI